MSPRWLLIASFGLGAIVAIAFGQTDPAWILGGVALGAAVVDTVALEPAARVLRSCAPLALPLLVIAVVGAIDRGWWFALGTGLLFAVVAWTWIVRPDFAGTTNGADSAVRTALPQVLIAVGAAIAFVLIAALLVSAGVADTLQAREAIGGFATSLFVGGVLLWGAALAIRLFSFGTNPACLTVSLSLAGAFYLLMVSAGVVDGPNRLLGLTPATLLAIAGCALAAEIVWVVAKARFAGPRDLSDTFVSAIGRTLATGGRLERLSLIAGRALDTATSGASRAGLIVALAASGVMALATATALVETADQVTATRVPGIAEIRLERGPAPAQIAGGLTPARRDLRLAKAYMPVLAFHRDQRWAPTRVDDYLDHPALGRAVLRGPAATRAPAGASAGRARVCDPAALVTPCEPRTVDNLPTMCPGLASVPCYWLTINCAAAEKPCADSQTRRGRTEHYQDGAVYVRVLPRNRADGGATADVFSDLGPYRDDLWMLVQYWYFYRYNEWKQRVLAGDLVQRHESDWEAVTIGLARDRPLFVGYSAHCGGSWRPWSADEVPAARTGRPWTHPVVAAAEGSQANYPRAEQRRPPIWDRCTDIPGLTVGMVSYAANVRDRTGYDWQWKPLEILPVTSESGPMSFPGQWGAHDETRLVNKADLAPLDTGGGPKTPSLQPLWQDPVRTIFCSGYWSWPQEWRRPRKSETCKPRGSTGQR